MHRKQRIVVYGAFIVMMLIKFAIPSCQPEETSAADVVHLAHSIYALAPVAIVAAEFCVTLDGNKPIKQSRNSF